MLEANNHGGNDMKMERIHDCLDGEISRSELTEEELEVLEELESTVDDTLAFARQASAPDVRASVMQRIAQADADPAEDPETEGLGTLLRDALEWIWAPRTVRIRPAWAMAGLAAIALAVGTLPLGTGGPAGTGTPMAALEPGSTPATSSGPGSTVTAATDSDAGSSGEPTVYVRFELDARGASSVRLAGNFTGWQPEYELAEIRPGEWSALVPLEPGVHDYAFVVDGERWMADPDAIQVDDGFGGVNSRIALVSPNAGQDVQS